MTKPFRSETLTCGCCGEWFKTWEGYKDQDQDKGYWICQRCQDAEQKKTDKRYKDTFKLIYDWVSDKSRETIDKKIKEVGKDYKIILVNIALEKWRIKRGF